MNTFEKLKETTLKLRKMRHELAPTMQYHLSEIMKISKNENREPNYSDAVRYLKKTCAALKEDDPNSAEYLTLSSFLPKMVTEEEISEFLKNLNYDNIGSAMLAIKSHFGDRVDMKIASKKVKETLK
jgi:uncharacterized protein YqeY